MTGFPHSSMGLSDPTLQHAGEAAPTIPRAWLVHVRLLWALAACVALLIIVLELQIHWRLHSAMPAGAPAVSSVERLASLVQEALIRGSFAAVAVLIFVRNGDQWFALLVSLTLLAIGSATDDAT